MAIMARMIAPAMRSRRVPRFLCCAWSVAFALTRPAYAHDFERTQVSISFARDGSFVLDVSNDPAWLKVRLEPFARRAAQTSARQTAERAFVDRIVLFVDGHEVRPASVEYQAGPTLDTFRMRGRMPLDAHTLRWYYGLVIDPYPLTIRRADGCVQIEEVAGDAWSRTIDLSGQFQAPRVSERLAATGVVAMLLTPLMLRLRQGRWTVVSSLRWL